MHLSVQLQLLSMLAQACIWGRITRSKVGCGQARFISNMSQRSLLDIEEVKAFDHWIASPKRFSLEACLHPDHLSDLFITIPTRDGTRKPFETPRISADLPYGHHLVFFHARRAEPLLRADGTDEDASPPAPFLRRMWAGGRIKWETNNPLVIGRKATAMSTITSVEKKGFDKSSPKAFVTQTIALSVEGAAKPSVIEERDHVYFPISAGKGDRTPRAGKRSSFLRMSSILPCHDSHKYPCFCRLFVSVQTDSRHIVPVFGIDVQCTSHSS